MSHIVAQYLSANYFYILLNIAMILKKKLHMTSLTNRSYLSISFATSDDEIR